MTRATNTHPGVGSARLTRKRAGWVAAGLAAGTAADVAFDPSRRHVPLCPFHALTGWWCPLCGGLRCVDSLVHGRWESALHDNAVLVVAIPLVVWAFLAAIRRQQHGLASRRWRRTQIVGLIVLLTAFTILRNLPGMAMLRPG
jgi:hypothetical protein